jgi:hypothetical protein
MYSHILQRILAINNSRNVTLFHPRLKISQKSLTKKDEIFGLNRVRANNHD